MNEIINKIKRNNITDAILKAILCIVLLIGIVLLCIYLENIIIVVIMVVLLSIFFAIICKDLTLNIKKLSKINKDIDEKIKNYGFPMDEIEKELNNVKKYKNLYIGTTYLFIFSNTIDIVRIKDIEKIHLCIERSIGTIENSGADEIYMNLQGTNIPSDVASIYPSLTESLYNIIIDLLKLNNNIVLDSNNDLSAKMIIKQIKKRMNK